MGGPTSPGGLKEQATRLTPLFEHDDDDDDDDDEIQLNFISLPHYRSERSVTV